MEEPTEVEQVEFEKDNDVCPLCGEVISGRQGRCMTCESCGWSLCGL